MKKILKIASLIMCCISVAVCVACSNPSTEHSNDEEKVAYLGESVAFENGVELFITRHIYKHSIQVGFSNYTTDDIFLCIEIKVKNNSNGNFSVSSTDIWLLYGETKINQVDIVFSLADGYCNISQPATTTKTYVSCFELSADIPFEDLTLVFDNGKWLENEQVKILMRSRA